jgi:hypothetical protein
LVLNHFGDNSCIVHPPLKPHPVVPAGFSIRSGAAFGLHLTALGDPAPSFASHVLKRLALLEGPEIPFQTAAELKESLEKAV